MNIDETFVVRFASENRLKQAEREFPDGTFDNATRVERPHRDTSARCCGCGAIIEMRAEASSTKGVLRGISARAIRRVDGGSSAARRRDIRIWHGRQYYGAPGPRDTSSL